MTACNQYAPGRELPQDVCENCGAMRQDHQRGQRAEALHTQFVPFSQGVKQLTKDQIAQGVRSLGPLPTEIVYPCGCKATGGDGWTEFPQACPNHHSGEPNADRQQGQVPDEQPAAPQGKRNARGRG